MFIFVIIFMQHAKHKKKCSKIFKEDKNLFQINKQEKKNKCLKLKFVTFFFNKKKTLDFQINLILLMIYIYLKKKKIFFQLCNLIVYYCCFS